MTDQSPLRNSFRAAVLRGERVPLLVEEKQPQTGGAAPDSLESVLVTRAEARRGDHRDQDRHRLTGESAKVRHRGQDYDVELVNLSAGGAMIRADFSPHLWELVELELGDGPKLEAAVRWIRGDGIGLEFAHETKIECDPEARAALLLDVIQRSFPDVDVELERPEDEEQAPAQDEVSDEDQGKRGDIRHPMVWSGQILFSQESNPVRLRNISTGGALVDVVMIYPVDSEVVLDLGDAGQFGAVVSWSQGEQAGLRFAEPFDLACLAKLRPDLTPYRWKRPSFLDPSSDEDSSPWDDQWGRSSLASLRDELEGFLKH